MSGSDLNTLNVYIGHDRKIAVITILVGSETELTFTYMPDWIKQGFAISPHLPLHGKLDYRAIRNFLQNLLPEGKGLEEIISNTTISQNNTFGLIKIIGADTSGALSFTSQNNAETETAFREITNEELIEKLARFKSAGESITYWDGRTRLSVAGVQDKLNLLEINGKLGFGEGLLCSNKIFKFETGKAPFIAVNELFTMLLAKHSGIDVPEVAVRKYGEVNAFVIDRFDRKLIAEQQRVMRRHIIDGCQATNLPPSYKYERQHGDQGDGIYIRDGVSFPQLFNVKTTNPEAYQTQLIRWLTFNIIVRNYDAHGKNISFFVGKQGLSLTPFYDLVNIEAIIREIQTRQTDENSNAAIATGMANHFAMSVGEYGSGTAGNFNAPFTAYMLADFAEQFGISLARLQLLIRQMIKRVQDSIDIAKNDALKQQLADSEIQHIDTCIKIIGESVEELSSEVDQITEMSDVL